MEHTPQPQPVKQSREFFYFFNASTIILAVASIVYTAMIQAIGIAAVQQNPALLIVSTISSLFGFAMFVASIIAIVLFKKWKYPNATLLSPIVYLVSNIFSGVAGGIVTFMQAQQVIANLSATPTQAEVQAAFSSFTLPLALVILYYVIALVQLVAAVVSLRAIKRS